MATIDPQQEIKIFEFYAKNIWPFHRFFVRRYLSPRCKKCGVSSKISPLNKSAVCELCLDSKVVSLYKISEDRQQQLENDLDCTFKENIGKGKGDFDAAVMLSGGKDSTLLLHKIKTLYPELRVVALTIDNTFMSPVAMKNVTKIVQTMNVPHYIVRPDPVMFNQAFSYAFTHIGKDGCAHAVDRVDGELFTDIAKHIVAKLKIPLLVIGFSFEQVVTYLKWDSFENVAYERKKREKVGEYDARLLVEEKYQSVWWDSALYNSEDIPHIVCPFYVWRMNEIEIKKEVSALGIVNEQDVSPLLTNNSLIPLCGLVDINLLGYSSWEPEFSRMVREGKTNKGLWQNIFELLEYSAKTGKFISKSVDVVIERLGLSREILGIKNKI